MKYKRGGRRISPRFLHAVISSPRRLISLPLSRICTIQLNVEIGRLDLNEKDFVKGCFSFSFLSFNQKLFNNNNNILSEKIHFWNQVKENKIQNIIMYIIYKKICSFGNDKSW